MSAALALTPVQAVIAAAQTFLGERISTNTALREQHSHGEDTQPHVMPDAVAFVETGAEAAQAAGAVPRPPRPRRAVRRRHLAGGPRDARPRRHLARPLAHDPHPRGQRRRHGLPHPAGRHPPATQRTPARPGPVLPRRPRLRMHHRRHVRHPRQRHRRRPLRHHPRERAWLAGGAARWPPDRNRRPGAQVGHRLRPHAPYDRLRGHAGRHHRNPAPPARHPGGHERRHLPVRHAGRRRGKRDRQVLQAGIPIARIELLDDVQMAACIAFSKLEGYAAHPHAAAGVPRHHGGRRRTGRTGAGDHGRATARTASNGPPTPRPATSSGRPGTTPTGPRSPSSPATRASPPTPSCRSRAWPS